MRGGNKKVLIIDDEREVREVLECILSEHYSVISARSATGGLRMLSEDIGVVFLDHVLPDSNGLEVLVQIKRRHPSIPVIFVTGYGSEDICQKAFRLGARDYIKKPFNKDEILSKADLMMKISNNLEERRNRLAQMTTECMEIPGHARIPSHILRRILKVKDYIDENYAKQITLDEASDMADLNRSYFSKYFKCMTGYSLRDYYNYIRTERAKDLLRDKKLSLADIAAFVGYSSVNYFIETFKKVSGYSPADFRKRIGIEELG